MLQEVQEVMDIGLPQKQEEKSINQILQATLPEQQGTVFNFPEIPISVFFWVWPIALEL